MFIYFFPFMVYSSVNNCKQEEVKNKMQPEFGKYLQQLRLDKGLSIRQLANLSKVSHSYLSQVENGVRGIPSPDVLKKLARPLGITYEELMQAAGYIEEIIDHGGYAEVLYRDGAGNLVDSTQQIKEMQDIDNEWANTAYRVAKELSPADRQQIDEYARLILEDRLKKNKK